MWSLLTSNSKSWNPIERLVFPTPQSSYDADSFPDELINIPREDGEKVPCLFLPFRHARFIIIYFHANGEDLGTCRPFCLAFRELFQVHVLAIEYPGYGLCPGMADESGILMNAFAAMRFVTETLAWPHDGIMLLGRSLGTGPTVAIASRYADLNGVILITPFMSIKDLFRYQVGALADMVLDRFPNYSLCDKIKSPTLIVHGKQDAIVPCEHGRQIFSKLSSRKMMVCPATMSHNSCLLKNVHDFVLPMTQFFAIPDYTFEEIHMPEWVFLKARSKDEVVGYDEKGVVDVKTQDQLHFYKPSIARAAAEKGGAGGGGGRGGEGGGCEDVGGVIAGIPAQSEHVRIGETRWKL